MTTFYTITAVLSIIIGILLTPFLICLFAATTGEISDEIVITIIMLYVIITTIYAVYVPLTFPSLM